MTSCHPTLSLIGEYYKNNIIIKSEQAMAGFLQQDMLIVDMMLAM